jgi:tetratricopeptide (TPR) repeat protein
MNANDYFVRANEFLAKGDIDHAIVDLTEAIKINPSFAEAYYNRGAAYYNKGNNYEAIADFQKASEIDPYNAEYGEKLTMARGRASAMAYARSNVTVSTPAHNFEEYDKGAGPGFIIGGIIGIITGGIIGYAEAKIIGIIIGSIIGGIIGGYILSFIGGKISEFNSHSK